MIAHKLAKNLAARLMKEFCPKWRRNPLTLVLQEAKTKTIPETN